MEAETTASNAAGDATAGVTVTTGSASVSSSSGGIVRPLDLPCPIDLVVYRDGQAPVRVYAKARYRDEDVALLVDTGSQITFLSTPPGTPDVLDYDTIELGCRTRSVAGRAFSRAEESGRAGLPVVGFVGGDLFREGLVRLDLGRARMESVAAAQIAPGAAPLPFTDKYGYTFVEISIDAVPLKLGFDTGAPHSLWIGVNGEPGDTPIQSVDGFGNPITLYLGSGTLGIAGHAPYEAPVMRILEHASIAASNQAIGVNAHGLFGLTSLPGSSFVFDGAYGMIWLELE